MAQLDMAARLRRLEDREEIRGLVAAYSLCVDNHDFAGLARLWAPGARYLWKGSSDVTTGADKVLALLRSRIEPSGPSFHVNHDQTLEWGEDPDRASGVVCAHAETSNAGGHNIAAIRYHDRYLRHEGRWTFEERALAFLYFTPVERYVGVLRDKTRLRLPNGASLPAHWPDFNA